MYLLISDSLTFIPNGMESLGQDKRDITRSMIIKKTHF